ncbi:MAG: hypothetical protein COA50_01265 [Flavobacteriaceae bacterium]|nr:MAG: hypothetical protein COA50_01265 [Flavobacteriaceae bacterium]
MLGKIHFFFGILVVIIFVLTGQYMDLFYNHLQDMEPMQRALFRTGHLYILLFGLINASLGAYFKRPKNGVWSKIQLTGSSIILFSTCSIIYSFFIELPSSDINRPIAAYSLYAILLGVVIHGIVHLFYKK